MYNETQTSSQSCPTFTEDPSKHIMARIAAGEKASAPAKEQMEAAKNLLTSTSELAVKKATDSHAETGRQS